MADIVNKTDVSVVAYQQQIKMANDNPRSAKIRSECDKMLEAMRDILHSFTDLASKDEIRETSKVIKDLSDNLMNEVVLLFRRVEDLEGEIEHFRG